MSRSFRRYRTRRRYARAGAVLAVLALAALAWVGTPRLFGRHAVLPTPEPGTEALQTATTPIPPVLASKEVRAPAPLAPTPNLQAPPFGHGPIVQATVAVPLVVPARPTAGERLPAWRRLAVPAPAAEGKPTLTIIIDDMGLNRVQSDRAVRLPAPLTLSWMPYAVNVGDQAAIGAAHGHETMLHMNMEALGHTDPGPDALRTWLPPETNLASLRRALDRLPGAVGLNQHEGSVASLSVPLMDQVMGELKTRGLLFVDSLTIAHSVALERAQADGVAAVPRNVFLDNSADTAAIRAQLAIMETIARHDGHVVAIGHPRPATMDVLTAYLPTVAARGFVLWPVSATVAAAKTVQLAGEPAAE